LVAMDGVDTEAVSEEVMLEDTVIMAMVWGVGTRAIFRPAVYAVLLFNQICSWIQGLMCVVNLSLRCNDVSIGCSKFVAG